MKRKLIAASIVLIGITAMASAGYNLSRAMRVYAEGDSAYADIFNSVIIGGATYGDPPDETINRAEAAAENDSTTGPAAAVREINFAALKAINADAVAWLYGLNGVIDYPVMKADDYGYYIDRLPDGTYNANGSLFVDYNCEADFSGPLTVVYGHSMKSGKMFGSLKNYKNQSYYDENPFMYAYTENGNYRIELLYGCVIGAGQWRERAFMYAENVEALLAYAAHNTTFKSGVAYTQGDRFAALSTCSYEFDDARYVLIGVLREE
jgi:sortase B